MNRAIIPITLVLAANGLFADEKEHTFYGRVRGGLPVNHIGYSCGYKSALSSPLWVSYRLTPDYFSGERYLKEKTLLFCDPFVAEKGLRSAAPDDFSDSGYWATPFFPHEDALGRSIQCEKEAYSLVNMVAFEPNRLTRGLWSQIEMKAREWARQFGEVWVITGPVFATMPEKTKQGRIAIPEAFYKIVARKDGDAIKTVSFKIPQNASGGPEKYRASVDEIERATCLDFFHELPDDVETNVEAAGSVMWEAPNNSGNTVKAESGEESSGEPPNKPLAGADTEHAAAGDVWADTESGVYYLPASMHYGKGKGAYMQKDVATQLGFREAN